MTARPYHPVKHLLIFGFLFAYQIAFGQNKYDAINFRIDSFASVGMPKSALQQVDNLENLARKYFILKQTDSGPVATEVDASHQPKTGDLLKVIVYLKAGRDFEYVQLKDMRPSGTEPVSVLSEYKYQDGLWYYEVTKDVATNFFIRNLNKGNYVFEYQLKVAQPGNFSTGITTVQCMYAPEFNAHSEGSRLVVK